MRAKARPRVHRTEFEWRMILDRFEATGRSQEAFCRESDIPVTTLQAVRRRLRDCRRTPAQFNDVTPAAASMNGAGRIFTSPTDGFTRQFLFSSTHRGVLVSLAHESPGSRTYWILMPSEDGLRHPGNSSRTKSESGMGIGNRTGRETMSEQLVGGNESECKSHPARTR